MAEGGRGSDVGDDVVEGTRFARAFTRLGVWWACLWILGVIPVVGGYLGAAVAVPGVLVGLWRLRAHTRDGDRLRFAVVLATAMVSALLLYVGLAIGLAEFLDQRALGQSFGAWGGASGAMLFVGLGQFAGAMRLWAHRHACPPEVVAHWRRTAVVTWSAHRLDGCCCWHARVVGLGC